MADEYRQRYGIRFEAFMNCVDVPTDLMMQPGGDANRPIRFVYVGGLHLNRWRALAVIGKSLLILREEGRRVELIIHAPKVDVGQYSDSLSGIATIHFGESLSQDQVASTMRAADVLVHVESFEPTARRYTRLSLSTKVPQYMASGRPILVYGPMEVASCRYIQESNCGCVVGLEDEIALLASLRNLTADAMLRARLGRRAWDVARKHHAKEVVREQFRIALRDAANSGVGRRFMDEP
ncbi:MAG: glycosyltransferase family protein [Pirellulaceae bacterium]